MTRVPVTVLTGFLGADKTTLLRLLLTQTDGRFVAPGPAGAASTLARLSRHFRNRQGETA